ncbi:MAG: hypothetical protein IKM26_01645, partial [Clostridia bacterium]|nr:hypothetical protein [Clostridia bacterium]
EYANKLLAMTAEVHKEPPKHPFGTYMQNWFDVFSKPNVEIATAQTYEKALRNHVLPVLGKMMLEEIKPADVQQIFNRMNGAKETKIKTRNILNMIFEQALEEEIIAKNPLRSRSIHITGKPSKTTEPYTSTKCGFWCSALICFPMLQTGGIWHYRLCIRCGWRKCWDCNGRTWI